MRASFFLLLCVSVALAGSLVFFGVARTADEYGLDTVAQRADLQKFTDIPTATGRFLGGALSLVGVLFFLLTLYGGVLWMTAHGNSEQEGKALKTLVAAIVGLIIVLSAYALTKFVFGTVSGGEFSAASCTVDADCGARGICRSGACIDLCDERPNTNAQVTNNHSCRDQSTCNPATIVSNLCRGGNDRVCCVAQ